VSKDYNREKLQLEHPKLDKNFVKSYRNLMGELSTSERLKIQHDNAARLSGNNIQHPELGNPSNDDAYVIDTSGFTQEELDELPPPTTVERIMKDAKRLQKEQSTLFRIKKTIRRILS